MNRVVTEVVKSLGPGTFKNLLIQIAEGKNPNIPFTYTQVKVIRGTQPHAPNTDPQEVRNSITLQFLGTPRGSIRAHLFNDGTIKTSDDMHVEINRRREEERRLAAEEARFPRLGQTAVRRDSETAMMAKIRAARDDRAMSIMNKLIVKQNAQSQHQALLREQARMRARAAEAAAAAAAKRK